MTNSQPEYAFDTIEPLLHKLAHQFWYRHHKKVPLDILISVGHEAYVECVKNWDPSRRVCKFSTYFSSALYRLLRRESQRWCLRNMIQASAIEDREVEDHRKETIRQKAAQMSPDAQTVVELILNAPEELWHRLFKKTKNDHHKPRRS